jgi:bla regulator protein blaR1
MTTALALSNLGSFCLQVAVLVAAGAALARALRLDEPRVMLACWRTLLLASLALPLCQPWTTVVPPAVVTTVMTPGSEAPRTDTVLSVASRSGAWPIGDLMLIVLAAGIAARALWLTVGAFALWRLRQDASLLDPLPASVVRAQERIGTRASVYISNRVSGPITFGLFNPIVVFPPSVAAMPVHVQEAIAYHELLHVRRRDWLYEVLEEAVRSVLWFHPAIWWLIGRIRLTREQVVDQAAVQLTDSRERYVEALLAVAVANSPAALAPASAFLRRHLLKKRVARILQETTMTTRRLIASLTVSAAALALAATFAVRSFPLEAQGQAPANSGAPILLVKGGEHLLHGELPEYPHRAIEQKVQGDVVVDMTLNDRGEVSDARVLSGPEELRKATLEAVLQWHYSPAAISSTVTQATLRFQVPADLRAVEFDSKAYVLGEGVETTSMGWAWVPSPHVKGQLMEIEKALEDPSTTEEQRSELDARRHELRKMIEKFEAERRGPFDVELERHDAPASVEFFKDTVKLIKPEGGQLFEGSSQLINLRTERVPESTAKDILAQAGVSIGDILTRETARRLQVVALGMDEHFRVEFAKERNGVIVTILTR